MNKRKFKLDGWTAISLACLAFFGIFFIYPIFRILILSVYNTTTKQFDFSVFKTFFTNKYYTNTIWNSLKVSTLASISALFFGTLLAYITRTVKIFGKKVIEIILIISVVSPPFIGAYSWIELLGSVGIITKFIKSLGIPFNGIYGFNGILLVFTVQLIPLVYLYVSGALKSVDSSLSEAAENLGAIGVKKFIDIIIPLIMPTLLASGLLVFMKILSDFGTPQLIGRGYRTLPTLIYDSFIGDVTPDKRLAATIAVIIILFTTIIFLIQRRASEKSKVAMSGLRPIEPKKAKGLKNILYHIYCWFFGALSVLPTTVVVYCSFRNTRGMEYIDGFSLNNYKDAFKTMSSAITHTYLYSLIAIIIVVILGVAIAYTSVRKNSKITSAVDVVSMVPYIIPGSVLGIALIMAFNKKPILLSGTAAIIIIAYVIRRIPYTIRSSSAILRQIDLSVEEASQSLGASPFKTFFNITLPMMANGIFSGAIMSWLSIIAELSCSVLLWVSSTKTLTIAIYFKVMDGYYGTASALGSILIFTTIIALLVLFKITGKTEIDL